MISLIRRRRVPAVALALGTFAASISTYICILSSAQAGPGSPDPRLVNPDGARGEPDKGLANPAGARGETDEGLVNQTRAWRTRRGPGEPDDRKGRLYISCPWFPSHCRFLAGPIAHRPLHRYCPCNAWFTACWPWLTQVFRSIWSFKYLLTTASNASETRWACAVIGR